MSKSKTGFRFTNGTSEAEEQYQADLEEQESSQYPPREGY